MSSEIDQDHSTKVEAAVNHLVDLHLQASHTYLSLGFSFDLNDNEAPKGTGRFFRELAEQKYKGAELLLKMQKLRGRALVQDVPTAAQEESDKPVDAMEKALAQEKKLSQALLDLYTLGAAHANHYLCNFLENHFLEEEMKLIGKMRKYLSIFRRLASLQAQRSQHLLWDLILKDDESPKPRSS